MADENPTPETPPLTAQTNPAAAPPAASITPPPDPKAPATTPGVYLDPAKFDEITAKLSRLDQIERDAAEKVAAAEKRAYDAAIKEGDSKKIAEMLDARLKADEARQARELQEARGRFEAEQKRLADDNARIANESRAKEARAKKAFGAKALADALGKHADRLAPNAFQQLTRLLEPEFSTVEEGDTYVTRSSDGRSIDDYITAAIDSDYYANFRKSGSSRGGTAHPGSNPSAASPAPATPAQPEQPEQFRNLGEWALSQSRKAAPGVPNGGFAGNGLRPALKVG